MGSIILTVCCFFVVGASLLIGSGIGCVVGDVLVKHLNKSQLHLIND